ncbi:uncharacterized protein LOC143144494 [Ptiloglossa arizonensis]|uniref:uncharacterized protein LOC143144494 n=1 Tax=Ptiloglossa arizonensis TaxID=3350558 RepID=UPI003F9FFC64
MSCPCWEQPRAPSRHAKPRSMNTRHFESFMHLQVVLARPYATHVAACALAMGMMTSQAAYRRISSKVLGSSAITCANPLRVVRRTIHQRRLPRNRESDDARRSRERNQDSSVARSYDGYYVSFMKRVT